MTNDYSMTIQKIQYNKKVGVKLIERFHRQIEWYLHEINILLANTINTTDLSD